MDEREGTWGVPANLPWLACGGPLRAPGAAPWTLRPHNVTGQTATMKNRFGGYICYGRTADNAVMWGLAPSQNGAFANTMERNRAGPGPHGRDGHGVYCGYMDHLLTAPQRARQNGP